MTQFQGLTEGISPGVRLLTQNPSLWVFFDENVRENAFDFAKVCKDVKQYCEEGKLGIPAEQLKQVTQEDCRVSFAILANDDDDDSDDESDDDEQPVPELALSAKIGIDKNAPTQSGPESAQAEPESSPSAQQAQNPAKTVAMSEKFLPGLVKDENGNYTPESVLESLDKMEQARSAHYAVIFDKVAKSLGIEKEDLVDEASKAPADSQKETNEDDTSGNQIIGACPPSALPPRISEAQIEKDFHKCLESTTKPNQGKDERSARKNKSWNHSTVDLKLGISEDEVDKMLDDLGNADSKGEDGGESEMAWVLKYLETAEPADMSEVPDDFEFMSFPFTSSPKKKAAVPVSNTTPAGHTNSEAKVEEAALSAPASPSKLFQSQKGKGRGAGSSPAGQRATKGKGYGKGKGKEKGKSAHSGRVPDDEIAEDDSGEAGSAPWERKRKALKERGGKFAPPETASTDVIKTTAWAGGTKNQIETPNDERRRKKLEELIKLSETHSVSKAEIMANQIVESEPECSPSEAKIVAPAENNASASAQQTAKADKKKSRIEMLRARHLQMQKQ